MQIVRMLTLLCARDWTLGLRKVNSVLNWQSEICLTVTPAPPLTSATRNRMMPIASALKKAKARKRTAALAMATPLLISDITTHALLLKFSAQK